LVIRVCKVSDVPLGEGRAVTVAGRRLALFRTATRWYALDNACPHRGGPLADGIVADRCVVCPLHDRRFDLATGAALTDGGSVVAHRVDVRDGDVLVALRST
jgi:nitrite reductase (NADH) small subunit